MRLRRRSLALSLSFAETDQLKAVNQYGTDRHDRVSYPPPGCASHLNCGTEEPDWQTGAGCPLRMCEALDLALDQHTSCICQLAAY